MESSEAASMHQLPSPANSKSSAEKKKLGVSSVLGRLYRGLYTVLGAAVPACLPAPALESWFAHHVFLRLAFCVNVCMRVTVYP